MKFLIVGPQGSGKGTIGEMLSKRLGIPLISVGDILRDLPKDHPKYQEVQDTINGGNLAPVEIVGELLKERVSKSDCTNGFIFDGWARRLKDIEYFDPGFDKVILLNISPGTSVKRLSSRRTCENCGSIFNIETVKPKVENVCDVCGGMLLQRDDDKPEAIIKRLDIFNEETMPVIDYFRKKGVLLEINAETLPEEIFENVLRALNKN
ncbi:hypothetical protein A3F07_00715 [candidate division WWE3 bacterium RIFCSPHIGHO2_12_FULL_38_15]|uniref:Adenylate kinase n=1 Tax=candidate division WWE3 bacterium RIFCSPHIGHO2_02_FULL_38_14 TaxID=1802620 RepID=A0A1F4VB65_UNCKA|nr:MAG: hypothetical protein A2793_00800 [candidate division WWE3 bacterium RIFCSPHIGHO2_01_FULL_38_45]OGC49096.1 MAG: hypothetical protein A3F07_00715 [candidate division WWE3 bacterium RIFCSPHIGHO2_12_FULL_38_15]OGC53551.1 MAG: hypothetical protein A3B64_04350 [candidate division WWE3 bacterium RIFCSPLOWO2_01_FULL_37_24]OGC54455.1 MAG: hypothetical protein A3D91_00980 [candidate division WWE3 bacterium RIFCSPHIGHO2_02_FULL_38_14]HLB51701.1 nucleoside monophosphate kinase [Patescibacteria grou